VTFIEALFWVPSVIWQIVTSPSMLLVVCCLAAVFVGVFLEPDKHSSKVRVWFWRIAPFVFLYIAIALIVFYVNNQISPFSWE
jgi:hypothetical protein